MKKVKIGFVSAVMLIILLFYQCQKGNLDKIESPIDYFSDDYIANLETLNGFYSVAIQNTKLKSGLKSSKLIIFSKKNQLHLMKFEFLLLLFLKISNN